MRIAPMNVGVYSMYKTKNKQICHLSLFHDPHTLLLVLESACQLIVISSSDFLSQ